MAAWTAAGRKLFKTCEDFFQIYKSQALWMSVSTTSALRSAQQSTILEMAAKYVNKTRGPYNLQETHLYEEITLKIRGSDEAVLDSYTNFMRRAATILNFDISGKIILPMNIEWRSLPRSPHVHKNSQVQYELRTHARMLQIRQITGDSSDIFLEYVQRNIPEGVSMSVEQTELEELPEFLRQKPREELQ